MYVPPFPGAFGLQELLQLIRLPFPGQSLYGVSSVHAGDGVPCPALFSTVGERREQVCKVLEMRARETAWATGLYRQRTPEALAAVVGLATLSLRA